MRPLFCMQVKQATISFMENINDNITELSVAARQAVQRKQWQEVESLAGRIQAMAPDNPEGHFLAGLAQKAARKPQQAVASLKYALELAPQRYDAAVELASQYSVTRENGKAAALLAEYQDCLDNSPRYLDMAATTYTEIGMPEAAWPLYVKAHELQPDITLFQANLAACSVYLGKVDEAEVLFRQLLARNPTHQRNHYQLARLKKATDRDHVDEMLNLLEQQSLPPERNIFLYYAIAKELEDLECWEEAFDYFSKAGDAVTRVANYDVEKDIEIIDTVIESCNRQWLSEGSPQASGAPTPIFIVGLPRTGTTLTERIIASHSQVKSLDETLFLPMVIRRESGVQSVEKMSAEMISEAVQKDIAQIGQGYLDAVAYRLEQQGETPFFIDKLPFNFLFLGFIAKAWPDARIVFQTRNPMDACFSMYKQVFTWAYKFSYNLDNLANYYIAYQRLFEHCRALLGDRLIEVNYESMVSDQEQQTRHLLDRLGLPFEVACLDFDRNDTATTTASSVQVRQKVHSQSVFRWQHYRQQLASLQTQLEAAGINTEVSDK